MSKTKKTFNATHTMDAAALEAIVQKGIRDQMAADGKPGAQAMDSKFIADAKVIEKESGFHTPIEMRWDAKFEMNRPVMRYENGEPKFLS